MTRPETCGTAGGAISRWINGDSISGGIISSQTETSSGSLVFGFFGNIVYDFDLFLVYLLAHVYEGVL